MRKFMKSLALASVAFAAILGGSALYAADSQGHGMMMGNGGMDRDGMMGMMGRMSRMMDHCSAMMRGGRGHRPNEQWRRHTPDKG